MIHASGALPHDLAGALASMSALDPIGQRIEFYPTIGSTNDRATVLAGDPRGEGTVVIADAQTAGRGRRGREWFSPPGHGLYVSVVLEPGRSCEPFRAVRLVTLAAGVALAEAVERATGLRAEIKWPNDLLVGRRKLAGILAEAVSPLREPSSAGGISRVVLGFGLNVVASAYPAELASRVTSLETELGRPVDRGLVLAHALEALAVRYGDLLHGRFDAILTDWRGRAPGSMGRRVQWDDGGTLRRGTTAGVDQVGALLVRSGDRIDRVVAGDVRWE